MVDLAQLILAGLFFSPLILGLLSVFFKPLNKKWVLTVAIGGWIAALLRLLALGEMTFLTSLSFFNEALSFSVSTTAVWLCLLLLVILWLLLFLTPGGQKAPLSPVHFVLLNLALSCGFLAFFSNQFMIRYMALEGVGLLAALTVWDSFSETAFKRFGKIFLMLRIGDLCLLAAILMILPFSNTLDISEMMRVAAEMPLAQRAWVAVGFVLAVLIKMAVVPFAAWLRTAKITAEAPVFWVTDFLMPALGLYLLYRVRPILQSHSLFQTVFFIAAAALILGVIFASHFRRGRYDRLLHLGSALQGFALLLAAFGSGATLRYYFVGLLLLRLGLYFQDRQLLPRTSKFLPFIFLALNTALLMPQVGELQLLFSVGWALLTVMTFGWDLLMLNRLQAETVTQFVLDAPTAGVRATDQPDEAGDLLTPLTCFSERLYQRLEITCFQDGTVKLSQAFGAIASWFQRTIEGGMERVWSGLGETLMALSEWTLAQVEMNPGEQSKKWVGKALDAIDDREQGQQAKPFRQDLIWIPLLLVLIICFLIISQRG